MTLDPTKIDWTATGALAAIIISIASLLLNGFNAYRDRQRLKIDWRYHTTDQNVHVKMVNAGRRPIVLKSIGFNSMDHMSFWEPLDERSERFRWAEVSQHWVMPRAARQPLTSQI